MSVDERGRAFAVEVRGCAEPFAASARDALLRWRWSAPIVGGAPTPVNTTLTVSFTPEGGELPPRQPAECRWRLSVAADGAVSAATGTPAPCAAWLAAEVEPALVPAEPGACEVRFAGDDRRALDLAGCPEPLRPLAAAVIAASAGFARADRTVVTIERP